MSIRAERDGDRWTLIFERDFRHAPADVWRMLTDVGAMREWSPFDSDRPLTTTGNATFTTAGSDGETMPADVRVVDEPRVLEYTWDADVLRWELAPSNGGTHLTLRHTMADRDWLAKVAAGWHICLDVAERYLDGNPTGRLVGEEARKQGWEPLHERYAAQLGVAS